MTNPSNPRSEDCSASVKYRADLGDTSSSFLSTSFTMEEGHLVCHHVSTSLTGGQSSLLGHDVSLEEQSCLDSPQVFTTSEHFHYSSYFKSAMIQVKFLLDHWPNQTVLVKVTRGQHCHLGEIFSLQVINCFGHQELKKSICYLSWMIWIKTFYWVDV